METCSKGCSEHEQLSHLGKKLGQKESDEAVWIRSIGDDKPLLHFKVFRLHMLAFLGSNFH